MSFARDDEALPPILSDADWGVDFELVINDDGDPLDVTGSAWSLVFAPKGRRRPDAADVHELTTATDGGLMVAENVVAVSWRDFASWAPGWYAVELRKVAGASHRPYYLGEVEVARGLSDLPDLGGGGPLPTTTSAGVRLVVEAEVIRIIRGEAAGTTAAAIDAAARAEAAADSAEADAASTAGDRTAVATDRAQADADAVATAADRVQTGLDRAATHADKLAADAAAGSAGAAATQTGLDAVATAADRVQTGLDAAATAADRAAVATDKAATHSDKLAADADAVATAADRVQTGLDRTAVATDKAATHTDKLAADADAAATAADRVQTGLDRTAANTSKLNAATSETNALAAKVAAEAAYDLFDDRFLGAKAADPTVDNDGNALVAGTLYFNTGANAMKVYQAGVWSLVTAASSADLANSTDDAKGAALVGFKGRTVAATLASLGARAGWSWLMSFRRLENDMDGLIGLTTDIPAVTFSTSANFATGSTLTPAQDDVASLTWATVGSDHVATLTAARPHGLKTGEAVVIAGAAAAEYNGLKTVTVTGYKTFTYLITASAFPTTPATGTLTWRRAAVVFPATDPRFEYSMPRAVMSAAGSANWQNGAVSLASPLPQSAANLIGYSVEFIVDDDEFEFAFGRNGFRLWVDGLPVTAGRRDIAGDPSFPLNLAKVTFAYARERRIRIEFGLTARFNGVAVKSPTALRASISERRPRVVAFWDSFGEGTGAESMRGVLDFLALKMGWNIVNMSAGGTGLTTAGATAGRYKYGDRLDNDLRPFKPDVVLVCASVNDGGSITAAAAGALFDAIAKVTPAAKIIGFGPLWTGEATPASSLTSAAGMKTACDARLIPYIDGGIGLNGGDLWLSASTKATHYNGTQATATASVSGGAITGAAVNNPGAGYSFHAGAPAVSLSGGGGSGGAVAAVMNWKVTDIQVLKKGTGYTSAPTVTISCGATALARKSGIASALESIVVTDTGGNYTTAPAVTISGGGGSGAAATAVIEGGRVIRIDLTNAGTGYTSDPAVSIAEATVAATATASINGAGEVSSIAITSGGSFYTSAPRVRLTGGGGHGAEAVAYVSGELSSLSVTSPGTGYATAPAVAIPHPTGSDPTHPKTAGHQMIAARMAANMELVSPF